MENKQDEKIKWEKSTFLEKEYKLDNIGLPDCVLCIEEEETYILSPAGYYQIKDKDSFVKLNDKVYLIDEDNRRFAMTEEQLSLIYNLIT